MRVLLTTCSLVASGGVELHVWDVCRQLLRRGCAPVVYAAKLGAFAQRLRDLSVPVVDDLSRLADPPDVIHGHYGLSLMAAALRFPDAPAVQTCHAWDWRGDVAPNLPQVRRRIAVDAVCRERLLCGFGLLEEEVEVLLNGVDLQRFSRRACPNPTPQRAAVFSNYLTHRAAEPILTACVRRGVRLDLIGRRFGVDCPNPEGELWKYDLVFAKGRCAWESLASGCAVIVADAAGLGPLVNSEQFDHQRRCNFGKRLMIDRLAVDAAAERIAGYDADDARRVCDRVRDENSLELMIDQLLAIYADAIEEQRSAPIVPIDERRLLAEYAESLCRELALDEPRKASRARLLRKQAVARADRFARRVARAAAAPWTVLTRRAA